MGSEPLESTVSGEHKTFIKTYEKTDDDEAFAGLVAKLRAAATKVTGREPSAAENSRWNEVGELLAAELEIAASRTQVTSAPAFLAEHLRRRLRKADAKQIEREISEASTVDASAAKVRQAKPELTPEQLQEQVNQIANLIGDGAEMRDLDERFSENFRPAQWHMIRSMALVQAGVLRREPKG